ncbi:MAG: chemotaxis protein CheX [Fibrobacterales bacterium]
MAKISIEHVNPFLKATVETYKTMLGVEPRPGKPVLNQGSGIKYDISGIIGLTGDVLGSVSMSFPKDTALKSISAFLGEKVDTLDDDAMDAIGELANIVAGYAKKFLRDFDISISLPTIIKGDDLTLKEPRDVFSFIVPFESDLGTFDVGVSLKSKD